jgi:hypothetical protein
MYYRLASDSVLLLHMAFILFVLFGGMLTVWWRWIPFIHIPAAAWGFFVEVTAHVCPLTYWENYFLIKAGQSGYPDSFVEYYLLDILYPSGLTREIQLVLAGVVVIVNITVYVWLFFRLRVGHTKDG